MKTQIRKEVDKGIADKLLLKDASVFQIIKQLHRSHKVTMVEIFVLGLAIGYVIGVSL
jgi:hypothetical protein